MPSKTYPQLNAQTTVDDSDLLASWRGVGPLKKILASVVRDYIIEFIQTGGIEIDGEVVVTNAFANNRAGLKIEQYARDDFIGNYGFEIHAYQGANIGFVLHDYTNLITGLPAMQIDKTNVGPVISLVLAENPVTSPGTRGEGPFIDFIGYGLTTPDTRTELGFISKYLQFGSTDPAVQWTFSSGVVASAASDEVNRALSVTALNEGNAAEINGVASGLQVATTDDDGNTLAIVKSGTGAGVALQIANAGTDYSIQVGTGKFIVDANGHVGVGLAPSGYGIAISTANATQASFASTGANNANIVIDSNTAGNEANVLFDDATVTKFTVGKTTANGFRINATGVGDVITISAAGHTGVGASGKNLGFFGATPAAQPAAPVTLGDVIAALQTLGLVAT